MTSDAPGDLRIQQASSSPRRYRTFLPILTNETPTARAQAQEARGPTVVPKYSTTWPVSSIPGTFVVALLLGREQGETFPAFFPLIHRHPRTLPTALPTVPSLVGLLPALPVRRCGCVSSWRLLCAWHWSYSCYRENLTPGRSSRWQDRRDLPEIRGHQLSFFLRNDITAKVRPSSSKNRRNGYRGRSSKP